ncbi:MAG: ATP-binding protein [Myxococcota bacterium]
MGPSNQDDLDRLEAELRQAQKMESVGRLAGGVAHDLNNVLTIIQSFGELLEMEIEGNTVAEEHVGFILQAADRAQRLTRQLLAFSRRQSVEPQIVTLADVTRNTLSMLRRLIGEDVRVAMVPIDVPWNIKVDPAQLEQVLLNLAVNARDAMPRGGTLTLETHNVQLDGDYARAHGIDLESGEYAMLAVSDTGCGIEADDLARIFEPFFTTKDKGKGTGLGLSTCQSIIKHAGGFIWVYSEKGIGTTFKVYLPRCYDRPAVATADPRPTSVAGGDETLLLVEDDAQVRSLFAQTLSNLGYTVLTAVDGVDALAVVEAYQQRIDVLISDVVMPRMSGPELAASLKSTRPAIRLLYMSGYTGDALANHGVVEPGFSLLEKPFTPLQLGTAIRNVLDRRSAS